MPSEKDGVMIILSSPSGAGKTTLANLLSKKDNFVISISHTTRNPRPGEDHKKDYFFVDNNEFTRLIIDSEKISLLFKLKIIDFLAFISPILQANKF